MKSILSVLIFVMTTSSFALEMKQNKNNVNMAISVSENILEIQMEAPMGLLLGFNQKPSDATEQAKWSRLQGLWFNKLFQFVELNGMTCSEEESSIEYEVDEDLAYGEILAKAVLKCNSEIKNAAIDIKLKNLYPTIHNIELTVFPNSGDAQNFKLNKVIENIAL